MKLRNKLAAITAAAMLAFTGVGFAAWTFNNSHEQETELGNYVTSAIEANDVVLSGNTDTKSNKKEINRIFKKLGY